MIIICTDDVSKLLWDISQSTTEAVQNECQGVVDLNDANTFLALLDPILRVALIHGSLIGKHHLKDKVYKTLGYFAITSTAAVGKF